MKENQTDNKIYNFINIRSAANEFPFSESALRHMIFLNKGGFSDKVVVRIGRKILLKRQALIDYLNQHSVGGDIC